MKWSEQFALRVSAVVREQRKAKGMSAQELSDACAALGVPIHRSTLANFENGRRLSLDVSELLVLAAALEVPPVSLLWPQNGNAEVLPGKFVPTYTARNWVRGVHGLDEGNPE